MHQKAMRKKILALVIAVIGMIMCGCGGDDDFAVKPATPDGTNTYSTQNRVSSVEYSIYMNKQITIFCTEINTRNIAIRNMDGSRYEDEAVLAEQGLKTLISVRDEVEVTYPPVGQDENREISLRTMNTAIKDVEDYIKALRDGKGVEDFEKIFENDFNSLTSLAHLYPN